MIGEYRIIALMTCRIHNKEQYEFVYALNKRLVGDNCRLFVYNCSPELDDNIGTDDPQTSVYELSDSSFVDAVIIDSNHIGNADLREKIILRAHNMGLPVISLGKIYEGCISIVYEQCTGIEDIVAHLAEVHGVTDFHMIAGQKGNYFSDKRIDAFKNALQRLYINFDESMLSYGDFWAGPAVAAVEKLLNENRLPRAFVCANDHMAIAVSEFLQSRGISVPEDVIVTGYDRIENALSSSPTITSAYIKNETIAEYISIILTNAFRDDEREGIYRVYPEAVFNESCGCEATVKLDASILYNEHTNMFNRYQNENILLFDAISKIHRCKSLDETVDIMDEHGLLYAMCCLIKEEYTDESVNPEVEGDSGDGLMVLYDSDHIYRDDSSGEKFKPYYMPGKDIIPCLDYYLKEGRCLIFTALNYLGISFGYLCFHFGDFVPINYHKIPQTSSMLSNALGGLINHRYKRYLLRRIERVSWLDTLTGLYNRRGFCVRYENLLEDFGNEPLEVVMCDLDGLKYINDNFGHEEGDNAIHTAAVALKTVCPKCAVCTRFGGDEMLAIYPHKEKAGDIRDIFGGYLDRYNAGSGKPYKVAASIGVYVTGKDECLSFEELVKKSDGLMYEDKKRRKEEQGLS